MSGYRSLAVQSCMVALCAGIVGMIDSFNYHAGALTFIFYGLVICYVLAAGAQLRAARRLDRIERGVQAASRREP